MEESKIVKAKRYLSDDKVRTLYEKAFNRSASNIEIKHLSGGLKNTVYLIIDGSDRVVLKVAPENNIGMISADKNTFWHEAKMLKLMEGLDIPTPTLLFFDDSCEIITSPYLFMTYLEGLNYFETRSSINEEDIKKIEYQLGVISNHITSIKADYYFLPSHPHKKFKDNFEFISFLFELLINDAIESGLDLGITIEKIRRILNERKPSLNANVKIRLANIDLWDGNILIKGNQISGVIDFSDLYYGDELMTFYFHTIDGIAKEMFLKGYQKESLTYDELVRIEIYRMYTLLKMIVECHLKKFGKNAFMYESLNERINNLSL